jgi:ribosomal protein S18 acetylase RimI-like enzyme
MFATASLAARIEQAESAMLIELGRAAEGRLGADEVVIAQLGGGVATYTGTESPTNKLAGLGFGRAPTAEELDAVERAFADRRTPVQAEFASLGDPAVPRLLSRRGYELIGFENVMGRPLDPAAPAALSEGDIEVRRASDAETRAWMDAVATGFQHPDVFDGPPSHESISREAIERIFADVLATPSFDRFIARRGGEVAGGASLRLHEGVAQLAGAATLPQHRRHGVQTALLRHRLLDSARRGCDVAVVVTQPGSKSTENVQRFGFCVLYVRAIMVKPAP